VQVVKKLDEFPPNPRMAFVKGNATARQRRVRDLQKSDDLLDRYDELRIHASFFVNDNDLSAFAASGLPSRCTSPVQQCPSSLSHEKKRLFQ
jgi:hypothetical protein